VASLIDDFIDGHEAHTRGATNGAAVSLADWSTAAQSGRSGPRSRAVTQRIVRRRSRGQLQAV
jgi:hypothetical protein